MAKNKEPEMGSSDSKKFMRERVVKPPVNKGRIARRILALFLAAVFFGVVACITFVLARPWAEAHFSEPEESEPIVIPKDEETEAQPTETEPTETEPVETEPIEDIVQSAIEENELDLDDYKTLYDAVKEVAADVDSGIVTVNSVTQEIDCFDNMVENAGQFSGIIIAKTDAEVLILTNRQAISDADTIKITFFNDTQASGTVKQSDSLSGVAVVSVAVAELKEATTERLKPLKLGNSYSVKLGDPIIAVGSPAGAVHSLSYGIVSYVRKHIPVPDGQIRLIYSDARTDAEKGSFLLNLNGELIGIATDNFKDDASTGMTQALAISDYKGILEKLTNGLSPSYLGIKGQDITQELSESFEMPRGVYVSEVINDSPAYTVGIQSGDIITQIGSKEIVTMSELQSQIEGILPEVPVDIVVQRKGVEEYKEIHFPVILGIR